MDEQPDVAFLVMNDQGFGVIKHIQDALYGGRHPFLPTPLPSTSKQWRSRPACLTARLTASTFWKSLSTTLSATRGSAMVEVDMAAIGTYPRYYVPPPSTKD